MNTAIEFDEQSLKWKNEIALKREIVIFGADYMANFPFYELCRKCNFENAIYNRSIPGLTTQAALELMAQSFFALVPRKLFLQLGENDEDFEKALVNYRAILKTLKTKLPDTEVFVVNCFSPEHCDFNTRLFELCRVENVKTAFINSSPLPKDYPRVFKLLAANFRNRRIDIQEAFTEAQL